MDEKYATGANRAAAADEIDALMLPWLLEHSAEEIFTRAQELNLPFGMVQLPASITGDVQLVSRAFFTEDAEGRQWPQLPYLVNGVRPSWHPEMVDGGVG